MLRAFVFFIFMLNSSFALSNPDKQVPYSNGPLMAYDLFVDSPGESLLQLAPMSQKIANTMIYQTLFCEKNMFGDVRRFVFALEPIGGPARSEYHYRSTLAFGGTFDTNIFVHDSIFAGSLSVDVDWRYLGSLQLMTAGQGEEMVRTLPNFTKAEIYERAFGLGLVHEFYDKGSALLLEPEIVIVDTYVGSHRSYYPGGPVKIVCARALTTSPYKQPPEPKVELPRPEHVW
jgi:hypothetical protein